jgi:hypothetical protein
MCGSPVLRCPVALPNADREIQSHVATMTVQDLSHLIGFYLIDGRPVKVHRVDNGLTATIFDVRMATFSCDPKYVLEIAFGRGDIETISESQYDSAVRIRRQQAEAKNREP